MAILVENTKPAKILQLPNIPGGFYIKARCIQDSAIAVAPPHVREIWDWLIKEANHKPRSSFGRLIQRGQVFTDYKEIQEALHWRVGFIKRGYKKHHVDYAMAWLRQELMITTTKTTRGLLVTICKYDYYQNPSNYEKNNDTDNQTTRLGLGTATIHKNDKELEECKEERQCVSEFYKKEIEACISEATGLKYKTLVEYLHGSNDEDLVFVNVLKIPQQLTYRQYMKVRERHQGKVDLREILMAMENTPRSLKEKKSLYLTLNNWANIRQKEK